MLESSFITTFIIICIAANTIVLSTYHYNMNNNLKLVLDAINLLFTVIFAIEIILKLVAYSWKDFCNDKMNLFDLVVVLVSIIEILFFNDESLGISAFRTIRIVRITRIFQHLKYMTFLITIIKESISKIVYLALLLLIFVIIFALLGKQLFGGRY